MVYMLSFYDKSTAEFIPVGIYDDKALAKKHMDSEPGKNWQITEFKLNKFDYDTYNLYQ